MSTVPHPDLPHTDTKAKGAADFYYAINATFRFLLARVGHEGWVRYLEDMGRGYYEAVNRQWRQGGLAAVARYWRAFFAAEPGANVEVEELADRVEVRVHACPAIRHLRAGGREIVSDFCRHCYHLGLARAEASGLTMRLTGGNGSCRHTFVGPGADLPPQDMCEIEDARS